MEPSSRTPEGEPNCCPVCGQELRIEPSRPPGDAPCPYCGHLLWFDPDNPRSDEAKQGDRLDMCFEQATTRAEQKNDDYAAELFTQCVFGDPGNAIYVQGLITNLQKKHGDNRKVPPLARFRRWRHRNALNRALRADDWHEVLKNGLAVLKIDPWNVPTLIALAVASKASGFDECESYYLRCAAEASLKRRHIKRLSQSEKERLRELRSKNQ